MRLLGVPLLILAASLPAAPATAGEVRIVRTQGGQLRIIASEAGAAELTRSLSAHLDRPLEISHPGRVTLDYVGGNGENLAWAVATRAGLVLAKSASGYRIIPASAATVTVDAYAASGREIIREMAAQCGIRNVALDPGLGDPALTVSFDAVPCGTAFDVVLQSAGWQSESAGNLMRVATP